MVTAIIILLLLCSGTCLNRYTKGIGKCDGLYSMSEYSGVDCTVCRNTQVLDCISSTVFSPLSICNQNMKLRKLSCPERVIY